MGKKILNNKTLLEKAGKPTTDIKKEKWTLAKYQIFEKDPDPTRDYA